MPEEERKGLKGHGISVGYSVRGWERTRMREASHTRVTDGGLVMRKI